MANCRSDRLRKLLTAREVAERYGFAPDRSGFIRCPFHASDGTASLKLYDRTRGWHCFGCNAGGSVIDFAMHLFGIGFMDAVARLEADFGISGEELPRAEYADHVKRRQAEKDALERFRAEYQRKTEQHQTYIATIKNAEPFSDAWSDAVRSLPRIERWLEDNPWR